MDEGRREAQALKRLAAADDRVGLVAFVLCYGCKEMTGQAFHGHGRPAEPMTRHDRRVNERYKTMGPRELVALSSQILAAAGHGDLIWGHASCRDDEDRGVWIKSAEWGMEEVNPDRVHLVDSAGTVIEGGGPRHSEYPIHTEIMAARPDVNGVVHTHARHAVALSATGQVLRPVSHAATMFVPPSIPRFTETADLILTPQLGKSLAAELGSARAIFLVNHGIVAVGPTLQSATVAAVVLERACEQQLLTQGFTGWPSWSGDGEAEAKRENIYSDRAVNAVWDYLVRQLP